MPEQEMPGGEFIVYTTDDGETRVECRFSEGTLWLSQALMAELFQTTPQNITLHLKALFDPIASYCQPSLYTRPDVGDKQGQEHGIDANMEVQQMPGLTLFDQSTLVIKSSSGGKFVSLTLTITATGPEQLSSLHEDLMASGLV